MDFEKNKYHRRSIRLKHYDYSQPGAYFITICTHHHKCIFGEIFDGKIRLNEYGKTVERCWTAIPENFPGTELDRYVIMPNHIHGIIVINDTIDKNHHPNPPPNNVRANHELPNNVGAIHELPLQSERRQMTIPKIIGRFKMNSAKEVNQIRKTMGFPLWQRNYYEHIIRNEREMYKIREYIINNPLKWEFDEYYHPHG